MSRDRRSFGNLADLVRRRGASEGSRTAFTFVEDSQKEDHWSYGQLLREATRIAGFIGTVVRPGERVLLLHPPTASFTTALYGCFLAGAVAVPVYPPSPRRLERTVPRLQKVVQDCDARAVLAPQEVVLARAALFPYAPRLAELRWIATDDGTEAPITAPEADPERHDLAIIQYTSGSTGEPKGAALRHGDVLCMMEMLCQALDFRSSDRSVGWAPPYHDLGLIAGTILPIFLAQERSWVQMTPTAFIRRPIAWLRAIGRYQATLTAAPNFAYEMCVERTTVGEREALDLSSLNLTISGAEPVQAGTLERFSEAFACAGFDARSFVAGWGLAEATLLVRATPRGRGVTVRSWDRARLAEGELVEARAGDSEPVRLVACGREIPGAKVAIVDPTRHAALPSCRVGEVWVCSDAVGDGYWNDPESASVFRVATVPDDGCRYLRSGDLGALDEHGELYITGRMKDTLIVRGRNIYPADLETVVTRSQLPRSPGVAAAFALASDTSDEEEVVILLEVGPDEYGEASSIAHAARGAVAETFGLNVAVALVERRAIPKTSSGKVQRLVARDTYASGSMPVIKRVGGLP